MGATPFSSYIYLFLPFGIRDLKILQYIKYLLSNVGNYSSKSAFFMILIDYFANNQYIIWLCAIL